MSRARIVVLGIVIGAALAAPSAWADGGCAKGYRDINAAERGEMTRVLDTAKKSIPAPPAGWIVQGDDSITIPTSICMDQEAGPWTYEFMRYYQQVGDHEARNKLIMDAAAEMTAQMQAKQPRLDALMAKMNALSEQVAAAAQKQDYARIEELNKEIEVVSKEYTAVMEEGGTTEKMQAASAAASRDSSMSVTVRANSMWEHPSTNAETPPPPAGASFAYRWTEKQGDNDMSVLLVLLGPWQPNKDGGMQATPRAGAPAAAAQVISVRMSADPSRNSSVVDATDINAIAATLSK